MMSPAFAAVTAAPIVEKQPGLLPTHSVAAAADELATVVATPQQSTRNIRCRSIRVINDLLIETLSSSARGIIALAATLRCKESSNSIAKPFAPAGRPMPQGWAY